MTELKNYNERFFSLQVWAHNLDACYTWQNVVTHNAPRDTFEMLADWGTGVTCVVA